MMLLLMTVADAFLVVSKKYVLLEMMHQIPNMKHLQESHSNLMCYEYDLNKPYS